MRSTAITSALITKLQGDAALMALTPDGIFKNIAGPSIVNSQAAKRFVIVSLVVGHNVLEFGRRSHQDALYLVEARMLSTAGGNINAAAERIDAILDPQPPAAPATLAIPGFGLMAIFQEEPTEQTEFDEADTSIRWDRAGGQYRVWTAPNRP